MHEGFMHRVLLLALLQLIFVHLILRNVLSFIACIVLLDYTARRGSLPLIPPDTFCTASTLRTPLPPPPLWAPAGSVRSALPWLRRHGPCEHPLMRLGTGLRVTVNSPTSDHLCEHAGQLRKMVIRKAVPLPLGL